MFPKTSQFNFPKCFRLFIPTNYEIFDIEKFRGITSKHLKQYYSNFELCSFDPFLQQRETHAGDFGERIIMVIISILMQKNPSPSPNYHGNGNVIVDLKKHMKKLKLNRSVKSK